MNRTLPEFITFTGVDEHTDIGAMRALRRLYPIEFGVLFSPRRQGNDPRYPEFAFVRELTTHYGHELAAHLCGGHTRALMDAGVCGLEEPLAEHFLRVQVNGAPEDASHHLMHWGKDIGVRAVILQCKGAFPDDPNVLWLLDASGGRGLLPASWPTPPAMCTRKQWGFAGGLGPDTVAAAVATIGTMGCDYWIDMESGVRDGNDRFSLEKCRAVCEAVYGEVRQ